MVVKYMHHGDDLVEHRTREASFGAQCTNHSATAVGVVAENITIDAGGRCSITGPIISVMV